MRYYWLRDRSAQQQFDIYWKPGSESEADYYTKHHPTKHHRQVRPRYVKDFINQTSPYAAPACELRGCVPRTRIR